MGQLGVLIGQWWGSWGLCGAIKDPHEVAVGQLGTTGGQLRIFIGQLWGSLGPPWGN